MALRLDSVTGCLPSPPMLHDATVDDVWVAFVDAFAGSKTRPAIRQAYEEHTARWGAILGSEAREQWLDGSFTTIKLDPEDLDFVTFFPLDELNALSAPQRLAVSRLFRGPETPPGHWCHAFVVPVAEGGTPEAGTTTVLRTYFLQWFGHARPEDGGHAKGILRVWVGGTR